MSFILGRRRVYNKITLKLSVEEAEHLMEAIDFWIEGFKKTSDEPLIDDLTGLFDALVDAHVIREKLWRRLRRYSNTA